MKMLLALICKSISGSRNAVLLAVSMMLLPGALSAKVVVLWQAGFPTVSSEPMERGDPEKALNGMEPAFADVQGLKQIVEHWRSGIIAGIPNLARHSRTPEEEANADYLAKSNFRFQQWILDTCLRPYDQAWLDYQQEIALRHTSVKKNKTDDAASASHVPLRDIIAFIAVINETIKPYLASKGHSADDEEGMHRAWC